MTWGSSDADSKCLRSWKTCPRGNYVWAAKEETGRWVLKRRNWVYSWWIPSNKDPSCKWFHFTFQIVNCSKFSLLFIPTRCGDVSQEILDHIAHVDLVVNFKSSEEELVKKNLGNRKFNSRQEYILMTSSQNPTKQLPGDNVQSHEDEVTNHFYFHFDAFMD